MSVNLGVKEILLQTLDDLNVFMIYLDTDETLSIFKDFSIVDIDTQNDLCLIYKKNHGLVPVTFTSKKVKIRDAVFIVGAPAANFPVEAEGYVSLPKMGGSDEDWSDRMVLSLDVFGGNSGGPIFNEDGNVVGIIVAGNKRYLHLGIAVKTEYILKFVKEYSKTQVKVRLKEQN